jgi:hypothetical protein
MEYEYHNRGRCISCKQIIWTTDLTCGTQCACTNAWIGSSSQINIESITDEEFISQIKIEFNIDEEIILIGI